MLIHIFIASSELVLTSALLNIYIYIYIYIYIFTISTIVLVT